MNRLLNALFCLFALILAAGAHAQTSVTVQQGVSGYAGAADTYLRSRAPTTNYGSAADLLEQTNAYAPLLRFAIFQSEGGPVPNGATIQAATLSLYKSSGGATPYGAYRLLKSWSESQASWNKATSAQNWSTAGASGSGTDIAASADASASTTSAAGWLDFNVTAALTAISAGGANYGWRVLPTGGSTDLKSFRSKEYASDPTQRPKLAITYLAPNAAPTVSLTTPANGASYSAPASLTLSASAADSDGTVAKVEFFSGTTLLATLTGAPYTYAWSNVPAGSYTLSAKATDNGGAATTSTAVAVSVVPGDAATLYFVHADHLDTPRLISDAAGITVWRWDNQEPFGLNAPSEDADGNGQAFSFNPRFPGQYFDNETGTFYNLNRDYDPQTGRYVESDPIGLRGGINTYAYVNGNPLNFVDPLGLDPWGDDPSLKAPPSICKYYDDQCKKNCADGYACAARKCCEFFGDYPDSNCTRKCLIDEDVSSCAALSGEERNKCRFRKHVKCYAQCGNVQDLSKRPWTLPQCQDAMNAMGGPTGGYYH